MKFIFKFKYNQLHIKYIHIFIGTLKLKLLTCYLTFLLQILSNLKMIN